MWQQVSWCFTPSQPVLLYQGNFDVAAGSKRGTVFPSSQSQGKGHNALMTAATTCLVTKG